MEQTEMIIFISTLLGSAIMLQQVVEGLKKYFENLYTGNYSSFFNQSIAIGLGVSSAMHYELDLMSMFTCFYSTFGAIMTGLILSQGANVVREMLKKLKGVKDESEEFTREWHVNKLSELPLSEVDDIYVEVSENLGVQFSEDMPMGQGSYEEVSEVA